MTFDDFIAKWVGKPCDFDHSFGFQCVDIMNQYCLEVLGIPNPIQVLPGATAYQIWLNANSPLFEKINNTPNGIPTKGDILFFNTALGPAGHVGIYISGDVYNIVSLDQNFPIGSLVHKQYHSYYGVAGWLHFKGQVPLTDAQWEQKTREILGQGTNPTDHRAKIKAIT